MNPYLIIVALGAVLAAGAGGFRLGADHEIAAKARADTHIAEAVAAATDASAKAISALKVKSTTITNKLETQIRTETVFRDCKLPSESLELINYSLSPSLVLKPQLPRPTLRQVVDK